ncbi:hypothetical protein ACH5RR_018888 [Cinchona calisaya]|uniref:Uncharacterized protein n=1 Tax=Cinchona calisaya TaxID=153742 RepID=A0ABD2ZMR4_9GENT
MSSYMAKTSETGMDIPFLAMEIRAEPSTTIKSKLAFRKLLQQQCTDTCAQNAWPFDFDDCCPPNYCTVNCGNYSVCAQFPGCP